MYRILPSRILSHGHRTPFQLLQRSLFIQTFPTPNPSALKFTPGSGKKVSPNGTYEFPQQHNAPQKITSPLATALLKIEGVKSVLLAPDFLTINKLEDTQWQHIKPDIFSSIMTFYDSGREAVTVADNTQKKDDTNMQNLSAEEQEVMEMIMELLDTRIRPSVMEDGGDIQFVSFDHTTGKLLLRLRGSCRNCSSSANTLKNGIENMMRHYIPEVTSVDQVLDELDIVNQQEFDKVDDKL